MELKTKVNDKKVFAKIGLAILVCSKCYTNNLLFSY